MFLLEGVDHDPSSSRLLMHQLEGRKCSLVVFGAAFKPKAVLQSRDHRQHAGCRPHAHDCTASSSVRPLSNQDTKPASPETLLVEPQTSNRPMSIEEAVCCSVFLEHELECG